MGGVVWRWSESIGFRSTSFVASSEANPASSARLRIESQRSDRTVQLFRKVFDLMHLTTVYSQRHLFTPTPPVDWLEVFLQATETIHD